MLYLINDRVVVLEVLTLEMALSRVGLGAALLVPKSRFMVVAEVKCRGSSSNSKTVGGRRQRGLRRRRPRDEHGGRVTDYLFSTVSWDRNRNKDNS